MICVRKSVGIKKFTHTVLPVKLRCALAIILLLSGCAGTKQFIVIPNQITSPEKGVARIYVMRPTHFATAVALLIKDNDKEIGRLGPHSYLVWDREPGTLLVRSEFDLTEDDDVSLEVEANQTYYVQQHVYIGLMGPYHPLENLSKEEGSKMLKKFKSNPEFSPKTNITKL